jgi:hypothetical protein
MDHMKPTLKTRALKQITARDFSGGLNLVDSEFNLASKYAVVSQNVVFNDNGDLQVRWGTRQLALLFTVDSSYIVAMEYYFAYIIAVMSDGTIYAVSANGTYTLIWSSAIAATKAGAPAGWTGSQTATFTQFLGDLIITNGVDKPLVIDNTLNVQYLQDLGTGTNINTPITKYVITHNNYVVMAGDPNFPGRLYISNVGTSGTWVNDPLPNDAVTFDVDKYAPDAFGEITGLASFRDRLLVFFTEYIVSVKLGSYSTAATPVHTPAVDDVVESFGAVSHRGIVNLGDRILFLDYIGVAELKQRTLSQQLVPTRMSALIDPAMHAALGTLSRATLQARAFATFNRRENRIMWFIPENEDTTGYQQVRVFAYSILGGGRGAWSQFTNWTFRAGCVSTEGRVFFGGQKSVYRYGSRNEPILTDYENLTPPPTPTRDGTADDYTDGYVYGTYCPESYCAQGIAFYHELPQNSLGDRTRWKDLHYITLDTEGSSHFTLSLYLDDLKKRSESAGSTFSDGTLFTDATGWLPTIATPYATMDFYGGDRGSHNIGDAPLTSNYRPTDNMNLYAMYGRFRFFKLAISGTSYSHLRIVSISLYHSVGGIY